MSFTVDGLSGTQEAYIRLIWKLADLAWDVERAHDHQLPLDIARESGLNITFARPSRTAPAAIAVSTQELVAVAAARTLFASHDEAPPPGLLTCVTEAFACRLLAEADFDEAFLAGLLWGVARQLGLPWIELIQQLEQVSPRARSHGVYGPAAWRALQAVRAHTDAIGRTAQDCGYTELSVAWAFVGATAMAVDLLALQLPSFDRPASP